MRAMHLAGMLIVSALLLACSPEDRPSAEASDDGSLDLVATQDGSRFSCEQCRIQTGPPIDVGEGISAPHRMGVVVRDKRGRYWIPRNYENGIIAVYDSAGGLLAKLGGPGAGPGEFQSVSAMAEGSSEMYLADPRNGRLNVFNDSLRLTRMHTLKFGVRSLSVLPNGNLVAWFHNPYGPKPASVHLLSDSARYIDALLEAPAPGATEAQQMLRGEYRVATTPKGHVLFGNAAEYAIKVAEGGQVLRELSSPVAWYQVTERTMNDAAALHTRLEDIRVDNANRAWLMFLVPDPANKDAPLPPEPDGMKQIAQINAELNTAIEVWDLNTGTLLTGILVKPRLHGFADSGHVYTYVETASGEVRARVWGVRLETPTTITGATL